MRKRLPVIAALLGGVAIAVVAMLVLGAGDDDEPRAKAAVPAVLKDGSELTGPDGAFKLTYPKGWKKLTAKDLGSDRDLSVAAISRGDGSAMLMVQQRGPLEDDLAEVEAGLTRSLKKSVKDFRFVKSNQIDVAGDPAVSYTFVRTKTNRVQNLVVIPGEDRTYTLNSVMGGQAEGAAAELAAIVKSFESKD